MYYLMLLGATLLLSGVFVTNKLYQSKQGNDLKAGLIYNIGLGLVAGLLFLFLSGFKLQFSWYSFILTTSISIGGIVYTTLGLKIIKNGSLALYTLFLMSGGTLLPYLFGIIFLNEEITVLRVIGIVFILGAIVISNFSKEKVNIKQLLMCIAVFLINGAISIFSTLNQKAEVLGFNASDDYSFIFFGDMMKLLISASILITVLLYEKRKKKVTPTLISEEQAPTISETKRGKKHYILIALLVSVCAILDGTCFLLQLRALPHLPASVHYPLMTGGSMIFTTVTGILVFKERPKKATLIAVAICFVSLFLFLEF